MRHLDPVIVLLTMDIDGAVVGELASQQGVGEVLVEGGPQCGGELHYKGVKGRTVLHPKGQPHLARGYHHCDHCGRGFSPLDEALGLGEHSWSPRTVAQEAAEAEAMVRLPSSEGWKEVKTVAISAVEAGVNSTSGEVEAHLTHHSYRADLWETATCANHLWAEASRRGLEKARLVVSVNDGAAWIWAMIWICFARYVQILDW